MEDEEKKKAEEAAALEASTKEEKEQLEAEQAAKEAKAEVEEQEKVELTKEEHEALLRDSTDLKGMIAAKQAAKLAKKTEVVETEETEVNADETVAKIEAATAAGVKAINDARQVSQTDLTKGALSKWMKDNKWADNDSFIDNIKIDVSDAVSEDQIIAKLDRAAQEQYPTEYAKASEDRIRAKVLAEQNDINVGGGGGGASVRKANGEVIQATAEDKRIADKFYGGDVAKYLKFKDKR